MDSVNPGGPGSGAQEWNPNDDMLLKWKMMLKADRALYKQHVYSFLGSLEQLGRTHPGSSDAPVPDHRLHCLRRRPHA